jgi:uncharacterized lipoprotein YajG
MTGGRPAALMIFWSLSALLTLGGCGARTSSLDVRYREAAANRAMLASVAPRRVEVRAVRDRRLDTTRIGSQPKSRKDIVTRRPVPDIVREALVVEVTKNGHAVVSDGKDVVLAVEVEEFWLDVVIGYSTTQYVGRVVISLAVTDGHTGDALLTRRYLGIRRQQASDDSQSTWREVMDAALTRTMRDLATDPELVAAFARRPAARGAPA